MTNPLPTPASRLDPANAATLNRLRSLSRVLDQAITIPGTGISIGIDPILGLLPFAGDYLGAALSGYIVLQAGLLGLPRATLLRMVLNIIFDTILGSLPVVGDLFDFVWKANSKNVELLEAHLNSPRSSKKADLWFLALLFGVLVLVVVGTTAISVFILRLLWQAISS